MNFRLVFGILIALSFTASCKKDPVDPPPVDNTTNNNNNGNDTTPPTGNAICLDFTHVVGAQPLRADDVVRYQNLNGDSFSIELVKYYISNIVFMDNNGNTWVEPESYHLVDVEDESSCKIYVRDVPAGVYTSVSYMIGVDSTRNVSGAQTGALDPANGMFWTWSSGYIMAKVEGHSPSSTASFGLLVLHIGGFGAPYPGQRIVTPSFNSAQAVVTANTVPRVFMKADINEWFQTPNVIDFSSINVMNTPGPNSTMFADNYMDMFSVDSLRN
jgi:hypothetical protein